MGKTADDSATFALELDDKTSGAASNAAGALKALRDTMEDDIAELKAMSQAMRNMKGSSVVALETLKQLKDQITAKKAAIAGAHEQYIKLGGNLRDLGKSAGAGGEGLGGLLDAAKGGGGPLSAIITKVSGLKSTLGGAGLAGAAAFAAVAIVALTVALVAATIALGSYGLAQANAARAERLQLEGLTKIPNWYGIAAGKASELQDAINGVAADSALGRDKISSYGRELYQMGLRGQNLKDALDATAIASSAAGESYGSMVKGMVAGAAFTGQSVKKVADTIRARFGGIAKAQTLDLNVQLAKVKENFGQLFTGLKIEGFLSALHLVTDLFSQNTFTGKALKVLVETLFNPMIAAIEKLAPIGKRFFQGMVIAALYFAIVVLTIRKKLVDTFGTPSLFKGIDWMKVGLYAGIAAGVLMIAVVTTLAGVFVVLGVAILASFLPLIIIMAAIGLAIGLVVLAVYGLVVAFSAAWNWLKKIDWGQLGTDIVNGIVDGLKRGYQWVIDAVKGLGKAALGAFRGALDSHSPSRKFFDVGLTAPQGIVASMKVGKPMVARSVADMMSLPELAPSDGAIMTMIPLGNDNGGGEGAPPGLPPAPPAAPAPSGGGVTIENLNYYSSGKENHQADAEDFKQKLETALEGTAIRLGAA